MGRFLNTSLALHDATATDDDDNNNNNDNNVMYTLLLCHKDSVKALKTMIH